MLKVETLNLPDNLKSFADPVSAPVARRVAATQKYGVPIGRAKAAFQDTLMRIMQTGPVKLQINPLARVAATIAPGQTPSLPTIKQAPPQASPAGQIPTLGGGLAQVVGCIRAAFLQSVK